MGELIIKLAYFKVDVFFVYLFGKKVHNAVIYYDMWMNNKVIICMSWEKLSHTSGPSRHLGWLFKYFIIEE